MSAPNTKKAPAAAAAAAAAAADGEKKAAAAAQADVVFVLGGPGSGKGTQSARIVEGFGFVHLSAGDLLRAERNSGSANAELINTYIKNGQIVPVKITVNLIKTAVQEAQKRGKNQFLIDGFPRDKQNLDGWYEVMGDSANVKFVLFFDCPEETMEKRLLHRGLTSGRADDNKEAIKKRFKTFVEQSKPIIDIFAKKGMVRKVMADRTLDEVYADVRKAFVEAKFDESQTTFAFIKPDAVAAGNEAAALKRIEAAGFDVLAKKKITLTKEQAEEFYIEHKGRDFFGGLVGFMTGGPAVALALRRPNGIKAWRALLGPTNSLKAKEEAPESLRAAFGTDGQKNAFHGSDSPASATRELGIIFPEGVATEVTFAFLKPDVVAAGKADAMLARIKEEGFEILAEKKITLTKAQAEAFYIEHKERDFFGGLVGFMTGGPAVALALRRFGAIKGWRALLGPTNSLKAKEEAPNSLRGLYGTDGQKNAAHGSDSPASAKREIALIFEEGVKM